MGVIDFNTLATSALAFTIAFAWNDAVNKTMGSIYPKDKRESARAALAYAIVATLLVIFFVAVVNHVSKLTGAGKPVAEVRWVMPAEKAESGVATQ